MRLFTRFIRDAPYTSHIPSVRIYVDFSFGPSADSPVFYSFSTQIMGPLITDERCRGIRFELLLKVITAVFGKGNIIRFCNRPFEDVEMMNETIISNWNNTVGLDDTVFHLGDFCLGGSAEWTKILDRLNGKIYLILGNHDLKNLRQGYVDRFEHVTMQMHIEVDKQKIYLNHYPFLCFDGGYKDVWQLFGHVHTRKNNTGIDAARLQYLYPTQYDVGVDNNNFMPVSFAQMKIIIEKQVEQLKMKEQ